MQGICCRSDRHWAQVPVGEIGIYIAEQFHTTEWESNWGDFLNGSITDAHGNVTFGLAVCNVPVGSKAFVKAYLAWKGTHILRGFNVIEPLLDPGQEPPSRYSSMTNALDPYTHLLAVHR